MKILSCGAGMQSTALALMSCENAKENNKYPLVPIYDAIIFCDLGKEPPWVYDQVHFIKAACEDAGIPFYILDTRLYQNYVHNFGKSRVVTIPFWSVDENGKKGKMTRHCTIDYKIMAIQKFFRWTLLGYKKGQRIKLEDIGTHEMHIGFSTEEKQRIFDSYHAMFVNKFPLVEMGLERKDNYAYIRDVWGLETKASACQFCPFHKNYFFAYLKENYAAEYKDLIDFDEMLESGQPNTAIKSKIFISRSRKRIKDLTPEECNDKECFKYKQEDIWNGF
jgi:hypothetical protein